MAALQALVDRPGSPRWATCGWCTSLRGPWRDAPRGGDDGDSSLGAPRTLVAALDPEPARVRWPAWLGGREDPVLLGVGVLGGKPGKRVVCDVPVEVEELVASAAPAPGPRPSGPTIQQRARPRTLRRAQ